MNGFGNQVVFQLIRETSQRSTLLKRECHMPAHLLTTVIFFRCCLGDCTSNLLNCYWTDSWKLCRVFKKNLITQEVNDFPLEWINQNYKDSEWGRQNQSKEKFSCEKWDEVRENKRPVSPQHKAIAQGADRGADNRGGAGQISWNHRMK